MKAMRRTHRKSRLGCSECKRLRIKCSEAKPICTSCQRRKVACVYPAASVESTNASRQCLLRDTANPESQTRTMHPCKSKMPIVAPTSLQTPPMLFDMVDMALLHHWTLQTSPEIFKDATVDHVWQKTVPRIAVEHPFVMHSLLCLAALHKASLEARCQAELTLVAASHYDKAIGWFREALTCIDQRNCHAVFAMAIMNTFYVFKNSGGAVGDIVSTATSRRPGFLSIDWVFVARGIGTVLESTLECVQTGPLSSLFSIGNWETVDPAFESSSADTALLSLRQIWRGESDEAVYDQTLLELRRAPAHRTDMRYWSGPFKWLHVIPSMYLLRLNQRQPTALVIFAYFGALVHNLDSLWWAKGCGKRIVQEVVEVIGPYWDNFLEWPQLEVGLQTSLDATFSQGG
ncbi:hypothetical protein CA14_008211 [Aspergillus flavus]|uniref:Zn(2)-C6 fungal-type domain-containing protein n=1 Tax=Aspergillus flavus TaxID=5059 RepID=A0AB74CMC4_ASPFL|nr:hypothetical protein CA14_008211 [Aspergillus flavus]